MMKKIINRVTFAGITVIIASFFGMSPINAHAVSGKKHMPYAKKGKAPNYAGKQTQRAKLKPAAKK